jgi:hypothetical protein
MRTNQNQKNIREALVVLAAAHGKAVTEIQSTFEQVVRVLEQSHFLAPDPDRGRPSPQADWDTLSVAWRGRSCFLGNTLLFRFFERLARSPNRYVSHLDLLDEVWGGERELATIRGVAKRLRDRLKTGGLSDLAIGIDGSVTGYYRLKIV